MRRVSIPGLFVLLLFPVHQAASASPVPDIIISEVQIAGATVSDEFIELRNVTGHTIDINGWKLRKRTQGGTESSIKDFSLGANLRVDIPAGGYLLWANSGGAFKALTDIRLTSGTSLTDNNSLALIDGTGTLVDSVAYGSGHTAPFAPGSAYPTNPAKGQSLVRDPDTLTLGITDAPSPEHTAVIAEDIPTEDPPTDPNPKPTVSDADIRINELFPNPKESGEGSEFIELYNRGETDADLSGFILRDASKTGQYILPQGSVIANGGYLVVSRAESGLSLNNTDETVSLSDPTGNPIDSAAYETTKEEASYSHDGSSFRFSRYLTPGKENRFGETPETGKTDIPKKAYRDVVTEFSASGGDDRKYFWDFGDGSTSRKQETTHTYEETGKYPGTLTISEGVEETVRSFVVDVEKYPKRKISIAAVSPNPAGDDTEAEWISLKNKDKKKIDLSGWSIATGSSKKKLSNHPIQESFVIKPGEERALGREFAAFSLPNGKGYVELRQPDGKVLTKASYDKVGGVKENEVWRRQDGGSWAWTKEATPLQRITEAASENPVISVEDTTGHETGELETIPTERETTEPITLEDLSPEDLSRLEAKMEEKVRRQIFAELLDDGNQTETGGVVLGASDEHGAGYSRTMFRRINQTLSGFLSER